MIPLLRPSWIAPAVLLLLSSHPARGQVFVNQSGYDLGSPKRFTAPGAPEGIRFDIVRSQAPSAPGLFQGSIRGGLGDFTEFNPPDTGEFRILLEDGSQSVPFAIGPNWVAKSSAWLALDFMLDARCDVGCHASCMAGTLFRDAHQFSFEIPSLVKLYLANPSLWSRVRGDGATASIPEIVGLIEWAAGQVVAKGCEHTLFKAQLAYYLFAFPSLQPHASRAAYEKVRDYTFTKWGNNVRNCSHYDLPHSADLLQLNTLIGSEKGQFPPGATLEPNLLLYEVARREGRSDSLEYFQAAYAQADWMVRTLDWNDPRVTKGQRMSEHVTLEGLAYFLHRYPGRAPPGLRAKIETWARVMAERSRNLWDFRKYSAERWTVDGAVLGSEPNEPGNVTGFPAAALAAAGVLGPGGLADTLRLLAYAHIDNFFGRNPLGRHFSYKASTYWPGVEKGWFSEHQGGNGMLQCARGVIDGSPKNAAYPFNPGAGAGYTEGWVAFNTAWNSTLAYLFADGTGIQAYDSGFEKPLASAAAGDRVGIRLRAPLDFDYAGREQGQIRAWSSSGDSEVVSLTEPSPRGGILEGMVELVRGAPTKGDGTLQVSEADSVSFAYGLEGFTTRLALPVGKPSSIGEAGSPTPARICRTLGACHDGSSGKIRIHDLRGRVLRRQSSIGPVGSAGEEAGIYLARQAGGTTPAPWSKVVHLPH